MALPTKKPLPPARPRLLGGYHVLDEIGRNAVGPLYLARLEGPKGFQRWAAIRRVDARHVAEAGYVQRFYDRVRAGAKLLHPNVTALFDVGEDEERPWLAMEYLHGERIEEAIERLEIADTPASWEIAARVIAGAADGLHAVHSLRDAEGSPLGLLHGDLAPHSLAVTYDGKTKVKGAFEPRAHGVLDPRKIAYAAPEQLFDGVVDARADVFALGVLLWELLAGKRLFARPTDHETRAMIEAGVVPALGELVDEVPAELDVLVRRALARDPAQRFSSARDLSRELESLLVSRGIVAREDDVGRYMRTLFADRYEERETQLQAAADVTEIFRRSQKLRPLAPLPPSAKLGALPDVSPKDVDSEPTTLMRAPGDDDDDHTTAEVVAARPVSGFTDEIPADSGPTIPRGKNLAPSGAPPDTDEIQTVTAPQPKTAGLPAPTAARRFPDDEQTVTAAVVKSEASESRLIMPSSFRSDADVTESAIFVAPRIPAPTPPEVPASAAPLPPPRPVSPSFPDRPLLPATPEAGITSLARPARYASAAPPPYAPPPAFAQPPTSRGPHAALSTNRLRGVLFPRDRARRAVAVSAAGVGTGAVLFVAFFAVWRVSSGSAPRAPTPTAPPLVAKAGPPPAPPAAASSAKPELELPDVGTPGTAATVRSIPTIDLSRPPKRGAGHHHAPVRHGPPSQVATPSGKTGYLSVMCHPDACDHIVDAGRDLGGSPLFHRAVSAGKHVLTLRVDSTHAQKVVTVDVPEGEEGVAIHPDVTP